MPLGGVSEVTITGLQSGLDVLGRTTCKSVEIDLSNHGRRQERTHMIDRVRALLEDRFEEPIVGFVSHHLSPMYMDGLAGLGKPHTSMGGLVTC